MLELTSKGDGLGNIAEEPTGYTSFSEREGKKEKAKEIDDIKQIHLSANLLILTEVMKQGVELPEASFNETPICGTFVVVSRKKDPLNQF